MAPMQCLAWCLLLLFQGSFASLYDPHYPDEFSLSWSEGWYIRVVVDALHSDAGAPSSFALVAGSYPRSRKGWNSSLMMALVQPQDTPVPQLQAFRDMSQNFNVTAHGSLITADPDPHTPPDFTVASERLALNFQDDACRVAASIGDVGLQLQCAGPPTPYAPNYESPEGIFASWSTRLVGQHWYVYSVATPVNFTLVSSGAGPLRAVSGKGWSHMEKNWSEKFPDRWVWAQGIAVRNGSRGAAFVLAGGKPPSPFVPGILSREVWMLGVHVGALSWQFHVVSTVYKVSGNPCGTPGTASGSNTNNYTTTGGAGPAGSRLAEFTLSAHQLLTGREVEIVLTAPVSSFTPLECPTRAGFQVLSQHSFAATAHLKLYEHITARRVLVHAEDISNAALEFGGDARCQLSNAALELPLAPHPHVATS